MLFTLGANDQYFGVQMPNNSEKGRKLPKIKQFALFKGQGVQHVKHIYIIYSPDAKI